MRFGGKTSYHIVKRGPDDSNKCKEVSFGVLDGQNHAHNFHKITIAIYQGLMNGK